MVYDHTTDTPMLQQEFRYNVYINIGEAAIDIFRNDQLDTLEKIHDAELYSAILVGSFLTKEGYITEGLNIAAKKADRTSFPIVVHFDYKNEPEESITKRKLEKRTRIRERILIVALLAVLIWRGSELLINIYNCI